DDVDQRDGDRGEADLGAPLQGGDEPVLAQLQVAEDVLEDDDRVVHQDANGQRQRHQRHHVQREAQEEHHDERRDERRRNRQQNDEGRPEGVQEHKQHQAGQQNGLDEVVANVVERAAREDRLIGHHVDLDVGGELLLERRELLTD